MADSTRIWFCECGRIHIEAPHYRLSFTPAEFLARLRAAAGSISTLTETH